MFEMSNGGTLYLKNVHFDGNYYDSANGDPLWLFNDDAVTVIFEDCTFTNNVARFVIEGATVTFDGCSFINNIFTFNGTGGYWISISNGATVEIRDTILKNNTNPNMYISGASSVYVDNTSFIGNAWSGSNGVDSNNVSMIQIGLSQIEGNSVVDVIDWTVNGNVLYCDGVVFEGNSGYQWIIYSNDYASNIVIEDSTFKDNDVVYDFEFEGILSLNFDHLMELQL